jgi:hypothetical protein
MTVDTLRRAANEMRAVNRPSGVVRDHPDAVCWLAVADWLDVTAEFRERYVRVYGALFEGGPDEPTVTAPAFAVARAYLGESDD